MLTECPVTGCQDQLHLPVYPAVPQNRKPLPTTYTEATILFFHHAMAESCHFLRCCEPRVSVLLCEWLMPFCDTVIPYMFSGNPVIVCQDKPDTGRVSWQQVSFHQTKCLAAMLFQLLFYGGELPFLTRSSLCDWLLIGTTKC